MATATNKITKNDVDMQRLRNSLQIRLKLIQGLNIVCAILASAVPLWMLKGVIEPLAGKETVVNANVVISITVAISVAVNIAQYAKTVSQRARLKELRARTEELERNQGLGIVGGS